MDKEDIYKMIINDDGLTRFLLSTPFTSNSLFNYSNELTESLFFEKMYVHGNKKGYSLEDKLLRIIKYNTSNTIFLLGNKGCGKTTFIHYLDNKIKKEYLKTINLKIIDFGNSTSTLKISDVKAVLTVEIYKLILSVLQYDDDLKCIKEYIKLYENIDGFLDENFDHNNTIMYFFSELESIIYGSGSEVKKQLKLNIRKKISDLEIYQMFIVYILLDIHCRSYNNERNKKVIVFDNLDNIIKINDICTFVSHYHNFQNGIGNILNEIYLTTGKKYKYDYTFIFIMREVTKAHISGHSIEMMRDPLYKQYDLTTFYDKKEIVLQRLRHIIDNKNEAINYFSENFPEELITLKKLINEALNIKEIIQDNYISKTIFPLFNNDYRICMSTIVKLCDKNSELIEEYTELMKKANDITKYGARGIIYRLIFNIFYSRNYFKKARFVNFDNRDEKKYSLSRLILTYLNNLTEVDNTNETSTVSLKELFRAFPNEKPEDITDCIWQMYNLIISSRWNHLLAFSDSKKVGKDGLDNERNVYMKSSDIEDVDFYYSTFRITCAGKVFLSNVCTHFEFFACRKFGLKVPPLFSQKAIKSCKERKYCFFNIIEEVYKEVKKCCLDMHETIESNTGICNDYKSLYNFENSYEVSQYHSERIIFTHISYLEAFRLYLISNKKELCDLEIISYYIIYTIQDYLMLIENNLALCSPKGNSIKCNMLKNIRKVVDNPLDVSKTINIGSSIFD